VKYVAFAFSGHWSFAMPRGPNQTGIGCGKVASHRTEKAFDGLLISLIILEIIPNAKPEIAP
jgi:hypothetical protein